MPTRRGTHWPRCRRFGSWYPTPRRSTRSTRRSPAACSRLLRSNTRPPKPSLQTPGRLRHRPCRAARWNRAHPRRARCLPTAAAPSGWWSAPARRHPDRRRLPSAPRPRSRTDRAAPRCGAERTPLAAVVPSARDDRHRAPPDTRQPPIRRHPGRRSPDRLHHNVVPAVPRSAEPGAGTARAR